MKYKLTNNTLNTDLTSITLTEKNGHFQVTIKYDEKDYYKVNVKVLTNIATSICKSIFKRKCVLIHCYKLLDKFHTNPKGLKSELKSTNYAQVFGSPWL